MRGKTVPQARHMEVAALYEKALLPAEEIAKRVGSSRQTITVLLRNLGVDTSKRRYTLQCSACSNNVVKTRAEVRKYENHFCSVKCYRNWLLRDDVQMNLRRMQMAHEKIITAGYESPGVHVTDDGEIYIFDSKDKLLEWKRSGLPMKVFAFNAYKEIEVIYDRTKA